MIEEFTKNLFLMIFLKYLYRVDLCHQPKKVIFLVQTDLLCCIALVP